MRPGVADPIVFLPGVDTARYDRLRSLADVVLSPYPYGAGLTAHDILDLPLATLPGSFGVGRHGLACYRKMGMSELVTPSREPYIALATRLGRERTYRDGIAGRIAAKSHVLSKDNTAVREHERFFATDRNTVREGSIACASCWYGTSYQHEAQARGHSLRKSCRAAGRCSFHTRTPKVPYPSDRLVTCHNVKSDGRIGNRCQDRKINNTNHVNDTSL
ncbi:MAG: hypothetical protein P4L84_29210 [Isosphaeraceae bacterium]|nr:hypothetical protein [Isosphaeraceae bacterium]